MCSLFGWCGSSLPIIIFFCYSVKIKKWFQNNVKWNLSNWNNTCLFQTQKLVSGTFYLDRFHCLTYKGDTNIICSSLKFIFGKFGKIIFFEKYREKKFKLKIFLLTPIFNCKGNNKINTINLVPFFLHLFLTKWSMLPSKLQRTRYEFVVILIMMSNFNFHRTYRTVFNLNFYFFILDNKVDLYVHHDLEDKMV